ncbi:TonB-dependent receptor plug domain-containing protein [Mucilaginibacter sp. 21P]|uniref:TonB-dependent receptor plug domain-containing protein n=1 Tax=Mucilaginibacter sp. 21P TaxID=2778902 RepID=UPI001C57BB9B|nr:Plug domain-containing protein [Mucilaginibacter sp. 21P]QXV65214.1 TonB-dependent receptor plug domain-containing protein [Mucilaginibacter sp. 21P]
MKKLLLMMICFFASIGVRAQITKPGTATGNFDHNKPLIILDGKKYNGDLKSLDSANVKSVTILKNKEATSKYGPEGANGVVLVTTKNSTSADTTTIKLRESASLLNDPLYVVDGYKVDSRVFKALKPEDIETVSVLKDASATALYGDQGKNGVILVATKAGAKGTKALIDANDNKLPIANNDPLYIIDGVKVDKVKLQAINPNDIESVNVLKDSAAAVLLHSPASYRGVIVITTKAAAKKAKAKTNN